MKTHPPIFIADEDPERGQTPDIQMFASVAEAEGHLEPIDVAKGIYVAFDSAGVGLDLKVVRSGGRERVSLTAARDGLPDEKFADLLRRYLGAVAVPGGKPLPGPAATLQDLIALTRRCLLER